MIGWQAFTRESPDVAAAGIRLLEENEVAFLATVSATSRPRIHPFVPRIVSGRLLAFIVDTSPKFTDLIRRHQYAIHTLPGAEDEEFFLSGEAEHCNENTELRMEAVDAMGFVTGVGAHEILFEFRLDRALWTRWRDFGTPEHRPDYQRWKAAGS